MSTILHPVRNHAWWYVAAAAALATGLVVVLMTAVFSGGSDVIPPPPVNYIGHGHAYAPPCFAGHPGGGSIELARSGCHV